jgi:secreted trypsin-like serine protease
LVLVHNVANQTLKSIAKNNIHLHFIFVSMFFLRRFTSFQPTRIIVGMALAILISSYTIFVDSQKRVIGGTTAQRGLYPWYAFGGGYMCGASFIWNDILLTAAHCPNTTFQGGVYAGGIWLQVSDQIKYPFHSLIRHPWYNATKSTTQHDIAVVKIASRYNGSIAFFNSLPERPVENTTMMTMGYGENNRADAEQNALQHVELLAWSNTSCRATWGNRFNEQMHLCSGSPEAKDTCTGDSGSPLLLNNRSIIVGIVSFGATPCAQPNVPAVNTRVSTYAPWIRTQICFLTAYARPSWCPSPLCIGKNSSVYQCTASSQCCGPNPLCDIASGKCV